jgi:hypothetical protein
VADWIVVIRERAWVVFVPVFEGWELFMQAFERRRLRWHDCEGQRHSVVARDGNWKVMPANICRRQLM